MFCRISSDSIGKWVAVPRAFSQRFYCTSSSQRDLRADLRAIERPGKSIRIRQGVCSSGGAADSGGGGVNGRSSTRAVSSSGSKEHNNECSRDTDEGSAQEQETQPSGGGASGSSITCEEDRNFTKIRYVKDHRIYEMYDSPAISTRRGKWVRALYPRVNDYHVRGGHQAGNYARQHPNKWHWLRGGAVDPGDPHLGQCMRDALSRVTIVEQFRYCDSLRQVNFSVRPVMGVRISKWGWPEQSVHNGFIPSLEVFCARARHDDEFILQVYLSATHTELHFIAVCNRQIYDGELVRPLSLESFAKMNNITRIVGGYRWNLSLEHVPPRTSCAFTTVDRAVCRGLDVSVRRCPVTTVVPEEVRPRLKGCSPVADSEACGTSTGMSSSCLQEEFTPLLAAGEKPSLAINKIIKHKRRQERQRKRKRACTTT
jgi:hypothetical protein